MSVNLSDDALLSVDEFTMYRDLNADGNAKFNTDRIAFFINQASQLVITEIGRKFRKPASPIVEVFIGKGTDYYLVANRPLIQLVGIEYHNGSAWVPFVPVSMIGDAAMGEVAIPDATLTEGTRYRVTYNFGYTIDAVPQDLKMCTAEITHRLMLKASGKEGVTSESKVDTGTTFNLADLSPLFLRVSELYGSRSLSG